MANHKRPSLIFADAKGRILDVPSLEMVGSEGGRWRRVRWDEWIPLPEGSELFFLPERLPVGYDAEKRKFVVLSEDPYHRGGAVRAVAAFVAPAHTSTLLAAYKRQTGAPVLPLFSYSAVGWYEGRFVTTAIRVDPDERQDIRHLNLAELRRRALNLRERYHRNRLVQHLSRCAITYACPAARNFFLGRWEAPLPSSPRCNARCIGCISLQEDSPVTATQDRITFVPTPDELAEVATMHLTKAPRAVVSFGQGCEGEPLLQAKTLEQAIRLMREETARGTINLNTNGSIPKTLDGLVAAGLMSVRISLNSAQPHYYDAYYRPKGYHLSDVKEFARRAKALGIFVSLNYFIMPGITDDPLEVSAFTRLLREVPVDLIQMRTFTIDPEWYMQAIHLHPTGRPLGITTWMETVRATLPEIRFGYFNPPLHGE